MLSVARERSQAFAAAKASLDALDTVLEVTENRGRMQMSCIGMVEVRPKRKTLKPIPRLYFFGAASHLFMCGILMCIVREHATNVCCLNIEKRNMKIQNAFLLLLKPHLLATKTPIPFLSSKEKVIYHINQ